MFTYCPDLTESCLNMIFLMKTIIVDYLSLNFSLVYICCASYFLYLYSEDYSSTHSIHLWGGKVTVYPMRKTSPRMLYVPTKH